MSKAGIHLSFSGGTLVVQGLRPGDLEDIPENILAADDRIGGAYRAKACDYAAILWNHILNNARNFHLFS